MIDRFKRKMVGRKQGEVGPLEPTSVQLVLGKERNGWKLVQNGDRRNCPVSNSSWRKENKKWFTWKRSKKKETRRGCRGGETREQKNGRSF
jgi:hypothetical protein